MCKIIVQFQQKIVGQITEQCTNMRGELVGEACQRLSVEAEITFSYDLFFSYNPYMFFSASSCFSILTHWLKSFIHCYIVEMTIMTDFF